MLFGSQVIKYLNSTLLLEHPVVRFERKTSLCFEANGGKVFNEHPVATYPSKLENEKKIITFYFFNIPNSVYHSTPSN